MCCAYSDLHYTEDFYCLFVVVCFFCLLPVKLPAFSFHGLIFCVFSVAKIEQNRCMCPVDTG